jgi:hypothetical protein
MKPARIKGKEHDEAKQIMQRYDRLKADRGTWDTLWQQIADYVQPRKSAINVRKTEGVDGYTDNLYNLTAVRANQILASGQMDYLFSGRWFSYDPPSEIQDDDAKTYYQTCTEVAAKELARSNWNLEIHEMLLDRGCFGTAALLLEEGKKRSILVFHKFDVGTFAVVEDHEGRVDTLLRDFELTARQAKQKFGEENLGPILRKACADPKKQDMKFKFIHTIHPREVGEYDPKKMDPENKPIASCYVSVDDKCMVMESGYDEDPLAVSRFLKWGQQPYGYSPSIEALPTVRQVNFIEMNMDALAEIAAFPRILVPDNLEGEIDLAAGGVTTFDPNAPQAAMPKEWGTQGRYDIGKDRVALKDAAIREAFHVDLFEMLKNIERQMTAYEVSQRLAEKVTAFSPTFYRLQTEVTNPLLLRVFNMLHRAGKFPEPPPSVLRQRSQNPADVALVLPEVTLTSKLALAIKAAENQAFGQVLSILAGLAQVSPGAAEAAAENYDFDVIARETARNSGLPANWIMTEEKRDGRRQARAEAQQQAMAAEAMPGMAKAAKDISGADPKIRKQVMGG